MSRVMPGGVQADGLADDQRRGDDARVHGGDVLECGGDEPRQGSLSSTG